LSNDPYYVKNLKAGVRARVLLDDLYDYLHYKPDGNTDGNETGTILKERGG
jgi:hypothetical protein